MRITTNNIPRDVIDGWELTPAERAEFDYIEWDKVEKGEATASFFRYKGELYDLNDTMSTREFAISDPFRKWDGYISETYFSGILVKYDGSDYEHVIVGRYCT